MGFIYVWSMRASNGSFRVWFWQIVAFRNDDVAQCTFSRVPACFVVVAVFSVELCLCARFVVWKKMTWLYV